MKVGIFGSYNETSVGDHAILEGILAQFRSRVDEPEFVVFSFHPKTTRELLCAPERVRIVSAQPLHPARTHARVTSPSTPRLRSDFKTVLFRLSPVVLALVARVYRGWRIAKHDFSILRRVSFWLQIRREIRELDMLLIGGGNLVMDMYRAWPIYPFIYALLARSTRTPVLLYAVGAGPIKTWRGRLYLGLACRLSKMLTFRDRESLDLVAESLGIKRDGLVLSADPALCLWASEPRRRSTRCAYPQIAMTVVPFHSPKYWPNPDPEVHKRYTWFVARVITAVQQSLGAGITLFATNYPHDLVAAEEVVSYLGTVGDLEVIRRRLGVQEILSVLADSDLVIGVNADLNLTPF